MLCSFESLWYSKKEVKTWKIYYRASADTKEKETYCRLNAKSFDERNWLKANTLLKQLITMVRHLHSWSHLFVLFFYFIRKNLVLHDCIILPFDFHFTKMLALCEYSDDNCKTQIYSSSEISQILLVIINSLLFSGFHRSARQCFHSLAFPTKTRHGFH